jgi:hypothetical protein
MKIREIIKNKVTDYFRNNAEYCGILDLYDNKKSRDHIINIGTSILSSKWEIEYSGGSFVQGFLNNDLEETFNRADHINQKAIYFYILMNRNIPFPREK